jgi:hypothetical protein
MTACRIQTTAPACTHPCSFRIAYQPSPPTRRADGSFSMARSMRCECGNFANVRSPQKRARLIAISLRRGYPEPPRSESSARSQEDRKRPPEFGSLRGCGPAAVDLLDADLLDSVLMEKALVNFSVIASLRLAFR